MTSRAVLFALLLLLPSLAAAQESVPQNEPVVTADRAGPPPPLAGIPLSVRCDASLPENHPALRRYPGQDLNDLAAEGAVDDAQAWADDYLCGILWEVMERGGAHPAPEDVRLPARAVLQASLQRLWIEGSRVVEQRIGSTIMPVSIPHWAVAMAWEFSFHVEYADPNDPDAPPVERKSAAPLELSLGGTAEQDDYAPLRMGSLLRAASLEAFADLPWLMADDGHLGDLLFALVPAPEAPSQLGLRGALADGFWQLLSTDARQRHDAMAFYLSSDLVNFTRRLELARWFLLNDPDVTLRRDALGWVMMGEPADLEVPLSDRTNELLAWLILKDRSSRMRAEAVQVLAQRGGEDARPLLVAASTDVDPRVADRALSGLRNEAPPTAEELEAPPADPTVPRLAAWTDALDGRVAAGSPAVRDQALLELAQAAMSPAAETWIVRWLGRGAPNEADMVWAVDAWEELASATSVRVRREALLRLGRESTRPSVAEILTARITAEPEAALQVVAIESLQRFDVRGLRKALLKASRSTNSGVRVAAVTALTAVEGKDVDARLSRLASEDPTPKVRRKAKKALRVRDRG